MTNVAAAAQAAPRRVRVHPHDGPMHGWFGLTYANYLVLPRSLIQEMPNKWQARMVMLLEEMRAEFGADDNYTVLLRDPDSGRFVDDPLSQYRHPDHAAITAARAFAREHHR